MNEREQLQKRYDLGNKQDKTSLVLSGSYKLILMPRESTLDIEDVLCTD